MADDNLLTPALEDYLEAVYVLQKAKDIVKVVDISEHLKVTMPSVTDGIRRLAEMDYVVYEKWRRVKLTGEGEKIARRINRRHEELYTFYHEILGADKDMSEKSACRVEHVLAPAIIERIICLTRWMQSLPEEMKKGFTDQIKAQVANEKFIVRKRFLDQVELGAKAVVSRVTAIGEVGQRLLDMGIVKGARLQVMRVAPMGDPIEIKIKGYNLSLRKSEAKTIEVEI